MGGAERHPLDRIGCPTSLNFERCRTSISGSHHEARCFLSFFVAEQFTGRAGKYIPLKDTIKSFRDILDGKYDDQPEENFYLKGGIEEVTSSNP